MSRVKRSNSRSCSGVIRSSGMTASLFINGATRSYSDSLVITAGEVSASNRPYFAGSSICILALFFIVRMWSMFSNPRAESKDEAMVKTLCARPAASLINPTLRENAAISLPRVFVSLRGLVALLRRNLRRLLAPALVDGFQTPFGAAARGADRLVADDDEDRVGV